MNHFVDEVIIYVAAGKGGKGCVSFRREKFVPRGGPDGGKGGKGGDVVFQVKQNLHALTHLRGIKRHLAKNGDNGASANKTGADGEDCIIEVPAGTVITDLDTGEIIVDLTDSKNVFIIAHGGKGGAGNSIFKNSTNQAPTYAQPGLEGQEKNLRLELKVIADVGLVGYPNAGKSTLISGMSNAKPETAPYPFTTITPHLGVVNMPEFKHFVIADIPGIIEGAHEGKGLGIKFLRHIERTSILLFMLDIFDLDPVESYKTLRSELKFHNKELLDKEFFVALNKIDSLDEEQTLLIKSDFAKRAKVPLKKIFLISALKKTGTEILKTKLLEVVEKEKLKLQSHQTNEINFNQEALE